MGLESIGMIEGNCGFCAELNNLDNENNLFLNWIKGDSALKSRVLYETDNFVVVPTIGCFVEGYLLVISKHHYACMGALPDKLLREASALIAMLRTVIAQKYGSKAVAFEHGALSCSNKFGGCLDHAHMHIVPFGWKLAPLISRYPMHVIPGELAAVKERWNGNEPYLFFWDIDDRTYFVENDVMPSQFLRQVICAKLGIADAWDWREKPFLENLVSTLKTLSEI